MELRLTGVCWDNSIGFKIAKRMGYKIEHIANLDQNQRKKLGLTVEAEPVPEEIHFIQSYGVFRLVEPSQVQVEIDKGEKAQTKLVKDVRLFIGEMEHVAVLEKDLENFKGTREERQHYARQAELNEREAKKLIVKKKK